MDCVFRVLLICLVLFTGTHGNLPPFFTFDMNFHVISENTPIGTSVYQLVGTDPEATPVKYGLEGTNKLQVDPSSGVVRVNRILDREENDTIRLQVTLEDQVTGNQDNNVVKVPVSIIILDENDNPPEFDQLSYEVSIQEDSTPGVVVLRSISLRDRDLVGDVITVSCRTVPQVPEACQTFEVIGEEATSQSFRGRLELTSKLDFSKRQIYQFSLLATDGVHQTVVPVSIKVNDIQNSPPAFTGSLSGIVQEDAIVGTSIVNIQAYDQDLGDPRPIIYELIDTIDNHFAIDRTTGQIRTARPLDRETLTPATGVITLQVRATEVVRGVPLRNNDSSSITDVTVTIRDVNDEPPRFNKRDFFVTMEENVPEGTPLPNLDIYVEDSDLGLNALYTLSLKDPSDMFSVEPQIATAATSVSIRLAQGPLDYENPNQRKFILLVVARDKDPAHPLSSTATVTVEITDTNDNAPQFPLEAYSLSVSETAQPGTLIGTIRATDRDSGIFGTSGIRYTLSGNGPQNFHVDPMTGSIYVSECQTPGRTPCLDFETKSVYYLSYQATDNGGSGSSTLVPLRISLTDGNDNPPQFEEKQYSAFIDEGSKQFEPRLRLVAHDVDKTSRVVYNITGGNLLDLFSIDSLSGDVRVTSDSGLQFSNLENNIVTLTVMANDGEFYDTTSVRITIKDINNNVPQFQQPLYRALVQENDPPGTLVDRVQATDGDVGLNAEINYKIQQGAYQDLAIDSKTGEIRTTNSLNFDTRPHYRLEVLVYDSGIPSLTGTTTVEVTVLNNNDKYPRFVPTTQRTQVPEDAEIGTVLHQLAANDSDVTSPDLLTFQSEGLITAVDKEGRPLDDSILATAQEWFSVDSATGEVRVSQPLSREVATILTVNVSVTDTSADPPQTSFGSLVITVLDVNDFPPTFAAPWSPSDPHIYTDVLEEQPLGTIIYRLQAEDKDSRIEGFKLLTPNPHFSLQEGSGVFILESRLNFEKMKKEEVVVIVKDTGLPQMTSTATVHFNIVNVNDEIPKFDRPSYRFVVPENSAEGTTVGQVTAIDDDDGAYGEVRYALAGGADANYFLIDEQGRITVNDSAGLDREVKSTLVFHVQASDVDSEQSRHTTSATVYVELLDSNDNAPSFHRQLYEATIVETIPMTSPIIQVIASDADEGINAFLYYSITEGNEKGLFKIDPASGIIYPAQSVQNGPKSNVVEVRCQDQNGTGQFSDTTRVKVTILPVNRHKPRFVNPSSYNSTVTVPENAADPKYLIMTVKAVDNDEGKNGEVTYSIREGENDVQETTHFTLNRVTGDLRTKKQLDREVLSEYNLVLVARDSGSPIVYETLRALSVKVMDENDNIPTFPPPNSEDSFLYAYHFEIVENLERGVLIGQIEGVDPDVGKNGKIYYNIVAGDASEFVLDPSRGTLKSNVTFDREVKDRYELFVKASNSPEVPPKVSVEDIDVKDSSLAQIIIKILDTNDNAPRFSQDEYHAALSYLADSAQHVINIKATDDDLGIDGALSYTIHGSYLYRYLSNYTLGSVIPSPFRISEDGAIFTAQLMAEYQRDRFILEVRAKEVAPPYREDNTRVHVWFYKPGDSIRIVLGESPEAIILKKDHIARRLSNVTGKRVIAADVRYHVQETGKLEQQMCDLYVVAVDERKLQIANVEQILKSVDNNYDYLKQHYDHYKIYNILPAELDANEDAVLEPALISLVALFIVLFIGSITVCVVCCCLRHWTPESPDAPLIKREVVETFNTTENPLWIDQKHKIYEEQELSMAVFSDSEMIANTTIAETHDYEKPLHGDEDHGDTHHAYATIKHDSRSNINLMEDYDSNYYSTLDTLMKATPKRNLGPKIPGLGTFQSSHEVHEYHELNNPPLAPGIKLNERGEPQLIGNLL